MLHRRTTSTKPGGSLHITSPPASLSPQSVEPNTPNQNQAFSLPRRQSANLYATPVSAPRARYNIPSPSPSYLGLSVTPPVYTSSPTYGQSATFGGSMSANGYGTGYGAGLSLDDDVAQSSAGGSIQGWFGKVGRSVDSCRRGMGDSVRLDKSLSLVFGDHELRTLVIKSTLINLLSLLLLSLFPLVLSPLLVTTPSAQSRTREVGMWYNLLLSWPVFVVCFFINAYWSPAISRRAQALLHPTYRHQPSPVSTPTATSPSYSSRPNPIPWFTAAITRLLLISDFQIVTRLIALVPVVGHPLATLYMSVIDAYYFFDSTFSARSWLLDQKVEYMQDRVAYMIGFGFPATFITSFGPTLVNMAFFALLYPLFVIQALQSRPPNPKPSLLPSTPSPHASLPTTPIGSHAELANNPFFNSSTPSRSASRWNKTFSLQEPRLPIFFFARYALDGLKWLEAALLRDRKGSSVRRWEERAGKRLG